MTVGLGSTFHLTLAEWAVLGLLGCGPQHAFALVKSLASTGELGRVWSVPTPVVYRAVNRLRDEGLVEAIGEERSDSGPPRTRLAITSVGRRRLRVWLKSPVVHMRDVRSELMLKLALLACMRKPAMPLVEAQLRTFGPIMSSLETQTGGAAGEDDAFEATLARWRLENGRAVMRFLNDLARAAPPTTV